MTPLHSTPPPSARCAPPEGHLRGILAPPRKSNVVPWCPVLTTLSHPPSLPVSRVLSDLAPAESQFLPLEKFSRKNFHVDYSEVFCFQQTAYSIAISHDRSFESHEQA